LTSYSYNYHIVNVVISENELYFIHSKWSREQKLNFLRTVSKKQETE